MEDEIYLVEGFGTRKYTVDPPEQCKFLWKPTAALADDFGEQITLWADGVQEHPRIPDFYTSGWPAITRISRRLLILNWKYLRVANGAVRMTILEVPDGGGDMRVTGCL